MANFLDLFTPKAISMVWDESAASQDSYIGADFFPSRKKLGIDLSWFKGSQGVPISLMPSSFDAQMTYRDRIGIQRVETEMPFFREGYKIKEKDRQELVRIQSLDNEYANAAIQRTFSDIVDLVRGARVVRERMAMQMLFPEDGNLGIVFQANGVDYTYNYDPDGNWKSGNYSVLTGADKWDAPATADPFKTFEAVKKSLRSRTGTTPAIALMNSATFSLMGNCDAIKNRYLSTNNVSLAYLTEAEKQAVIEGTTGLSILVYDEVYRDESKTVKSFIPDNYVAVLPNATQSAPLGNMWMSQTPEELDLNYGGGKVELSIVDTGVAITRDILSHPVNTNIWVSMIALPSFERMDECALIKVA